MAETFAWSESNLVGQVVADGITNVNLGSVDDHELNTTTYPVTRGTNSFAKYIRAKFTGTWTTISNMKFWKSAGALDGEEAIKADSNVTYATPSQVDIGDGDVPTVVGSALSVNSAEGEATIVYGVTGVSGYSAYIRLQGQYTSSMPSGAVAQKTFCFQYDVV